MKDHDLTREHQQVWESLPWMANGTASAEQRHRANTHLAGCADCRRELAAQQRLLQAVAEAPPHPAVDAEAGLLNLLDRLDAPAVEQPLPSPAPPHAPRREANRLTMALAVAVVVQAIGLGVLGLQLGNDDHGSADYRTLSTVNQQPEPAAAPRPSLQVVPAESMTMADWQRLLQTHGLRVVGGPNAVGAYALAPAAGAQAQPIETLLARLRATPGVRMAEPVEPAQ